MRPPDNSGPLLYGLAHRVWLGDGRVPRISLAAILRRNVQDHRLWMSRGYAIGLGARRQMLCALVAEIVAGPLNELTHDSVMALSWVITWRSPSGRCAATAPCGRTSNRPNTHARGFSFDGDE